MVNRYEKLELLNIKISSDAKWEDGTIHSSIGEFRIEALNRDTELWFFKPFGKSDVDKIYQVLWLDLYQGLVFGYGNAKRVDEGIFRDATIRIRNQIQKSLSKELSPTIKLSHASEKIRQNLERLQQTKKATGRKMFAAEVIRTVLQSNTYIWRAAKIHREVIKKILAAPSIKEDGANKFDLQKPKKKVSFKKSELHGEGVQ